MITLNLCFSFFSFIFFGEHFFFPLSEYHTFSLTYCGLYDLHSKMKRNKSDLSSPSQRIKRLRQCTDTLYPG